MKRPQLKPSSESPESDAQEQIQEAVTDVIRNSPDKTVEIRPADESKGMGKLALLALVAGALGLAYWMRKADVSTESLKEAASGTADQTKSMTEQAADTIEEGGQKVAETVDQEGDMMADEIEKGSEEAADKVEQKGEDAAEKTEEAGEEAADKVDEVPSGSSSS